MNTDLRQKVKNDFQRDFFKLVNNAVFKKNIENVRKHKHKLVTTEVRRIYLVANYHSKFFFLKIYEKWK